MNHEEILAALRDVLVTRLKFDRHRVTEMSIETPLPKGIDGSIGLDSLDFIELGIAIEERFGITMDESQDLTGHFASFDTLCRFIAANGART